MAILALSQSGSVLITSTGDVATAGQTGIGIYARAGQIATVYASGNITTLGDNAPGIAASGYTGTIVVSSATIRTSGTDSHGITAYGAGDVVVTSTSKITTTGPTSDGINVVSTNGMAAVVNSGDISATGSGSAGIYAVGYAGSIVMNLGNVVGGPCCAGVMQRSANATTLLNWGTITAGLADFAIESDSASNTVENFGTVTGDVSLTGGPSAFNNHAGALFNSGASVQAGLVTNDGVIAPGGRGTIETTALGDDFVQTGTGVFAVDVDAVAGNIGPDHRLRHRRARRQGRRQPAQHPARPRRRHSSSCRRSAARPTTDWGSSPARRCTQRSRSPTGRMSFSASTSTSTSTTSTPISAPSARISTRRSTPASAALGR